MLHRLRLSHHHPHRQVISPCSIDGLTYNFASSPPLHYRHTSLHHHHRRYAPSPFHHTFTVTTLTKHHRSIGLDL
jgi:hypothetical protein